MADATVKAWRCDICKTVYTEDSCGYNAYYDFHMGSRGGYDLQRFAATYAQVCLTCAQKIDEVVMELEK